MIRNPGRMITAFALIVAIMGSIAAAPPEVVRLKAPASEIGKWFPKGSELVVLKPEELDELARKARERDETGTKHLGRILRANHRVRWSGDILIGKSTFVVRRADLGASLVPLAPWNLAVDPEDVKDSPLRTTDGGRVFLWMPPAGPSEVTIVWRRAARPLSEGRSFALELPEVAIATLELDLPEQFIAESFSPLSAGHRETAEGRRIWRHSAASGPLSIQLRARGDQKKARGARPWVSGPTEIDLGPASATFRADWSVDMNSLSGPLRVGFTPGLEPTDASGPDVESMELRGTGDRVEMTIHLRPELRGTTSITLRGLSGVRTEGPWTVPAAWPIDAEWLGGNVAVRLDRSHTLASCLLLQGRRLPVAVGKVAERPVLLLEPVRSGPVAELVFSGDGSLRNAQVQGAIRYARAGSTLLAEMRWTFPRGRPGELAFDLTSGWSIEALTVNDVPVPWRRETLGGGLARVRMTTPTVDGETIALLVRVRAVGPTAAEESQELPRVRPVGVPADEFWIATADDGRLVVPKSAEGLAWLDPHQASSPGLRALIDPAVLAQALAWRWTSERASATAVISAPPQEVIARAEGNAVIAAGRMRTDWRLSIRPGARPLSSIPLGWSSDGAHPMRWKLLGNSSLGSDLTSRPILPGERTKLGIAESIPYEVIDLAQPTSIPITLEGTVDRPWSGSGPLPIPRMPADSSLRGSLNLRLENDLMAKIESHGLRDIEADRSGLDPSYWGFPGLSSGLHLDRTFGFDGADVGLQLTTSRARGNDEGQVVAARLTTSADSTGRSSHRLAIRFLSAMPRELALTMPPGTELRRAEQGNHPLEILSDGKGMRILTQPERRVEVTLDYVESRSPADIRSRRLRPTIPTMSTTCLNFLWSVVPPNGSTLGAIGTGFVIVEPMERRSVFSLFGGARFGWIPGFFAKKGDVSGIDLANLTATLSSSKSASDSKIRSRLLSIARIGPAVVVDRIGFEEAGLGPDSLFPLVMDKIESGSTPIRLELGELCIIPRQGILAVTPRSSEIAEAYADQEAGARLDEMIRSAAANGSSDDSRWVALEEWCANVGAGYPPSSAPLSSTRRANFACSGWPARDCWADEVPVGEDLSTFSLGMAIVLGLGLAVRRCPPRPRAIVLAIPSLVVYLYPSLLDPLPRGVGLGVQWGLVGAWLILPPRRRSIIEPTGMTFASGTSISRVPSSVSHGITALAVAALLLLSAHAAAFDGRSPDVILAIFPFDGPPDLHVSPTRAILRLADYERLKIAASRRTGPAGAFATDALHRVETVSDRSVRISSVFSLVVHGDDPAEWRIPMAGAWEIRATLDGQFYPIRLEDEGRIGLVIIRGSGNHRLRVDRVMGPDVSHRGSKLIVPINPIPRADVELHATGVDSFSLKEEISVLAARPSDTPTSIGPKTEIEVIGPSAKTKDSSVAEDVNGLILWDALPAGDRVRLRLAPSGADPIAEVKLRLDADVRVRMVDRHRVLRSAPEERGGTLEWLAAFDPPCTRNFPVEIELWRSRAEGGIGQAEPRRLPRIAVIGRSLQGVIAFRRPGDWSGRLEAPGGLGSRDEEGFVASWGPLPDEPLTLAGAEGFRGIAGAEVRTQPNPQRRSVTSDVRIDLGEGRVDLALEAALNEVSGQSSELNIDFPPEFLFEHVGADGLVSWCRPSPGRIHLELAGVAGRSRKVVVRGYLRVDPDAPLDEVRRYRMKTPWPRWPEASEETGLLTLVSATKSTLEGGSGLTPRGEITTSNPPTPASRKVYQVERPYDAGVIQWLASTPRVSVFLQSRLSVNRTAVELDSAIRYEVTGGPLDMLHLRLPTAWANDARVHLVGATFQRTAEVRGEWTTWAIRPERPIWGTARLRVHCARVDLAGRAFPFPDIVPLGQGRVEKIISVDRQESVPIEIEGSPGLQSVDPSRFEDGWPEASASSNKEVYRVLNERWAMTIRPAGDRPVESPGGTDAVLESQTSCSLRDDGLVLGTSTFLVDARLGSALRLRLGPQMEILAACVGGRPAPFFADREGICSIPFNLTDHIDVDVVWSMKTSGPGTVALPRPDQRNVPTLVKICAAPSISVRVETPESEAIGIRSWRLEQAERIARRVIARIGEFDRSSPSEESELRGMLFQFALVSHLVDRAARPEASTTPMDARAPQDPLSFRLDESRRAISESLELYGLDDFRPALDRGGAPEVSDFSSKRGTKALANLIPLGQASYYQSGREVAFAWMKKETGSATRPGIGSWLGIAAIVLILLPRSLGMVGYRSRTFGRCVGAVLISLAIAVPVPGTILLLAAWIGRT